MSEIILSGGLPDERELAAARSRNTPAPVALHGTAEPPSFDEIEAAAHSEIRRLNEGGKWQMRIPADEARDSDLIICRALTHLHDQVTALRTALAERDQRLEEVTKDEPMRGDWICDRCGFVESRREMSVVNGAVRAMPMADNPRCPNDGEPLRTRTWREFAKEVMALLDARDAELASLRTALASVAREREENGALRDEVFGECEAIVTGLMENPAFSAPFRHGVREARELIRLARRAAVSREEPPK